MKKSKPIKPTNFWFGFSLGIGAATIATYLLATKSGREKLKKIVEFTENISENAPGFIEEIEKKIADKAEGPEKVLESGISSIENIIKKIKDNSHEKSVKKFFIKE
jgi:gas vesicle protein